VNKKQIVLFAVVVVVVTAVAVVTLPMFCLLHLIVGLCLPRTEGNKNFMKFFAREIDFFSVLL